MGVNLALCWEGHLGCSQVNAMLFESMGLCHQVRGRGGGGGSPTATDIRPVMDHSAMAK